MANSRIERVLRHDGIVAVLDWFTDQTPGPPQLHHANYANNHVNNQIKWAGDDRWHAIVHEAVKLRQISGETSVRVLVGEHAVLVSGNDEGHVVGVVFIKGHPVVKSVVRMVRQLLRPASTSSSKSAAKGGASSGAKPKKEVDPAKVPEPPRPPTPPPGMNSPLGRLGPMGMPPAPMGMPPRAPMPPAPMGMPGAAPGMERGPMGMPPGGVVPPRPPLLQPGGPAANQGPVDLHRGDGGAASPPLPLRRPNPEDSRNDSES